MNILDPVLTLGLSFATESVSLVSLWHHIARWIQSHNIHLDLAPEHLSYSERQLAYLELSGILSAVRRIEVLGYESTDHDEKYLNQLDEYCARIAHISALIPRIPFSRKLGCPVLQCGKDF